MRCPVRTGGRRRLNWTWTGAGSADYSDGVYIARSAASIMSAYRYIGFDEQLARALGGISSNLDLPVQPYDADQLDALCLSNNMPEDLASLRDPARMTIVYLGRFEYGADGAARLPLRDLAGQLAGHEQSISGIAVLNAWIIPPAGAIQRQGRWVSGTMRPAAGAAGGETPWTELFWPDGFDRCQADIPSTSRMVSKVDRLAYDCFEYLGIPIQNHIYELHLTVNCRTQEDYSAFETLCASIGIKCIQIMLPNTEVEHHTITGSFHRGTVEKVFSEAKGISNQLAAAGFPVTRIKIESTMSNPAVPVTRKAAALMKEDQYFECHAKVIIPPAGPDPTLRALCEKYDAHISQNPSNRLADGSLGVFLTQRFFKVTKGAAIGKFEELLRALRASGYAVSNVLKEYALLDTNFMLDEEWIPHVARA